MNLQTLHNIPHNRHALSMPPELPATRCVRASWRTDIQDDPDGERHPGDGPIRNEDEPVIVLQVTALPRRRERMAKQRPLAL
jgi:hypothetical protein